jgi:superfamily II DNA or RNA helicase
MKVPSLQDLKRLGPRQLRQSLEPSALERGAQFLREGAFEGFEISQMGSSGQRIEFQFVDPAYPQASCSLDVESPGRPVYTACDCNHASHGIFCKHQAAAVLVCAYALGAVDEFARLPETVTKKIESVAPDLERLRALKASVETAAAKQNAPALEAIILLDVIELEGLELEQVPVKQAFERKPRDSAFVSYLRPTDFVDLGRTLYLFEDGTLCRSRDLPFFVGVTDLAPELIPQSETLATWIASVSRYQQLRSLPVFLSSVTGFLEDRRAVRLNGVLPHVPDELERALIAEQLKDQPDQVRVRYEVPEELWLLGGTFALHRKDGTLSPHRLERGGNAPSEGVFTAPAELAKFSVQHGSLGLRLLGKEKTLAEGEITPCVELTDSGELCLTLTSNDGLSLSGLSPAQLPLVKAGQEGLRWLIPLDFEREIEGKKSAKTPTHLKLFKHAGVALVVIEDCLSTLLAGTEWDEEQQNRLEAKIAVLLLRLEGTVAGAIPKTLESMTSRGALEIFRKIPNAIRDLTLNAYTLTWTEGTWIKIPSWGKVQARVLLHWLRALFELRGGDLWLRSRDAWIDPEVIGLWDSDPGLKVGTKHWLRFQNKKRFELDLFLKAFSTLPQFGIGIRLNELPVEELTDSDWKSDFMLNEIERAPGKIDWFELHPRFYLRGAEISETQAKELAERGMLRHNGKVFRVASSLLPQMEELARFWEQIQPLTESKATKKKGAEDKIYPLARHATLELLLLRASGLPIRGGQHWANVCQFYDRLGEERPQFEIPKTFHGELKPYQVRGVEWIHDLYQLRMGGILADDMGLGKTVQTLAFLEHLRLTGELGPTLVIVPTSLTFNWKNECERFTPHLSMHLFQSRAIADYQNFITQNPASIVLVTYGLLAEHAEMFQQTAWNIHIYDEAQHLKTLTAKRTTASRQVRADFKICLTGTPLENHLGELFSLVDLVVPGSLGALDRYKKTYLTSYAPDPERVRYLKLKTRPLILRRTKRAILTELPAKTESSMKIPFTEKQLKIYRDIALSWNSKVREIVGKEGEAKSQMIMLTALLRLRQACSAPSAIPNVDYTETPPKVSLLVDTLSEVIETGESALVFTQFMSTFQIIAKKLKEAQIPFFELHGKVSRKDREDRITSFQNAQGGTVFLMTLKTGGVGLNLTKASYVFHLEPWWNPAVENQATDRTHRIGQTKPVQVYRYIMSDSVEEKIEILKQRKSAQFDALFSDVETTDDLSGSSGRLSHSDFEYLLGFGK